MSAVRGWLSGFRAELQEMAQHQLGNVKKVGAWSLVQQGTPGTAGYTHAQVILQDCSCSDCLGRDVRLLVGRVDKKAVIAIWCRSFQLLDE